MSPFPGSTPDTLDPVDAEYLHCNPEDSPFLVNIQMDAIDGITRDVVEGVKLLPRRGLEVGGLLLGRVEAGDPKSGDQPVVWIERYQRISCEHRFGPQFVLDDRDRDGLESAASTILENRDLAIVGLYRSHTRPGIQLESQDLELIGRYFSDPTDLVLLIKPDDAGDLIARLYARDAQPIGESFPFRGHRIGSGIMSNTPEADERDAVHFDDQRYDDQDYAPERPDVEEHSKDEVQVKEEPDSEATAASERHRRLVPDFLPPPVTPARRILGDNNGEPFLAPPLVSPRARFLESESAGLGERLKKWAPLLTAILLVAGILWFVLRPGRQDSPAPFPQASAEPGRPLGLSVEPMGAIWQLSWNPNATALQEAHGVELFVREGDDQNRFDLTQRDLIAGTYQYRPTGNDVTFRLEVTDRAGRVNAESFRLSRAPIPAAGAPAGPSTAPSIAPSTAKLPSNPALATATPPKAVYKAPPVVAAGIRPRIKGMIPIDVRAQVDAHGRVTAATPITKQHSGLETYLATCAVKAARLWRFEPARDGSQPVPGTTTIHFVFEK